MSNIEKATKLGSRVRIRPESRNYPGEYGVVMGGNVEVCGSVRITTCEVALDQDEHGCSHSFDKEDLLWEFKVGDHVRVAPGATTEQRGVDAVIVSNIHSNEDTSLWEVAKQSNLKSRACVFYENLTFVPHGQGAFLPRHEEGTKSLGLEHPTSKERNLQVKKLPVMNFEDLISKEILPNTPSQHAAPLFKDGYFNSDILQIGKPFNADLAYLERRMFAALGIKQELLGEKRDHLEKQEATTLGFEKKDPEVQKRIAAEKLARFAESYGMSQEIFKEYMNMPIPADEARVAAKKNRLKEMKNILDRGLCIPKEHMAEYKALVDEVGEEYRLDMEKKQAENRLQRERDLPKWVFPKLSFNADVVDWAKGPPLKETWSATIVLASGREVRIPDPNPEKWELVEELVNVTIKQIFFSCVNDEILFRGGNPPGERYQVVHEAGRCWIKDMARIVSQTERTSPFEERFSYLIELRHFKEKATEENSYPNALPTLSVLW